jgi:hypothetical protein
MILAVPSSRIWTLEGLTSRWELAVPDLAVQILSLQKLLDQKRGVVVDAEV